VDYFKLKPFSTSVVELIVDLLSNKKECWSRNSKLRLFGHHGLLLSLLIGLLWCTGTEQNKRFNNKNNLQVLPVSCFCVYPKSNLRQ
jgi:hypothetical protein